MKKGFTLIELLIVVAIIAILAAIAVPNFLEAQTRSKISRAKSDLRTLAVGLEAYTVDYNKPPLDYDVSEGDPEIPSMGITMAYGTSGIPHPGFLNTNTGNVHPGLTTPISYLTVCWLRDPFVSATEDPALVNTDQQIFTYNWLIPEKLWGRDYNTSYAGRGYYDYYGAWRICSIGPDRTWYNRPQNTSASRGSRIYDATNGTVSYGNIWRSQKEPHVAGRPAADQVLDTSL